MGSGARKLGIRLDGLLGCQLPDCSGNVAGCRNHGGFQGGTVGRGGENTVQPTNGGIQIVKASIRDACGDFGAQAKGGGRFFDDQQSSGLLHGVEDQFGIEW